MGLYWQLCVFIGCYVIVIVMVISSKKADITPVLIIGDYELGTVTSYEYLGMLVDNKLSMPQQINNMYKKANMRLGILCKIKRYISEGTASRIYKTMIRPHMEYIDFIIDSGTMEKVDELDKLQDKALRRIEYCSDKEERQDYEVLRNKYNSEKLSVRRKRSLLRIMYDKSRNNENIEVITHDIELRNRTKVKLKNKFSGLTKLHNSPYYRGCVLWESLPEDIQKAENRNEFKNKVKIFIK